MSKLALLGGDKAVTADYGTIFNWPIVNKAMEDGVLTVLREGNMSGTDITKRFETEFAKWQGCDYALAHSCGTAALQSAMFAVGLGPGDEMICPSITYWASAAPAMGLGASIVYCDIDPKTLCIDPKDFEAKITPRTKAVVVVHYCSYPAPMDEIMAIAKKHNLKVIEDVSHAQGGYYKGTKLGNFGDVAAMSLMSGKSFAIGEGGILVTSNREILERAMLWAHYERSNDIKTPALAAYAGLPAGGYKYRMHQLSSIVGLEQLKKYDDEITVIDKAMNYFWDLLADLPGLGSHRPTEKGSTKAGWYACKGLYNPNELDGLSLGYFCQAVTAEGVPGFGGGCNAPLHTHPLFFEFDMFNQGKPTNFVNLPADVKWESKPASLPVSETISNYVFNIPWFKHFDRALIEQTAAAVRKVVENRKELLATDPKEPVVGKWFQTRRRG